MTPMHKLKPLIHELHAFNPARELKSRALKLEDRKP